MGKGTKVYWRLRLYAAANTSGREVMAEKTMNPAITGFICQRDKNPLKELNRFQNPYAMEKIERMRKTNHI
ncbi:hypothetical protein AT05_09030 [Schleiferia thermophila str. Yellowstone]|nr:hypothetical protein AT05_09030 [Schleiferia thermophila str. Yellowstone]